MASIVRVELIDVLKTLKAEQMDLDDMVALYSSATQLKATYEQYKVQVPAFVTEAMSVLDHDIKVKRREHLLRLKAIAEGKRSRLLSREEQRTQADQEIADLEALLKE